MSNPYSLLEGSPDNYYSQWFYKVKYPIRKPYFSTDAYPSGISSYVRSIYSNDADSFLNTSSSEYPSGLYALNDPGDDSLSLTSRNYIEDHFPYPSGFRRKFPREIWSTSNSGNHGEKALFVSSDSFWFQQRSASGYLMNVTTPIAERSKTAYCDHRY